MCQRNERPPSFHLHHHYSSFNVCHSKRASLVAFLSAYLPANCNWVTASPAAAGGVQCTCGRKSIHSGRSSEQTTDPNAATRSMEEGRKAARASERASEQAISYFLTTPLRIRRNVSPCNEDLARAARFLKAGKQSEIDSSTPIGVDHRRRRLKIPASTAAASLSDPKRDKLVQQRKKRRS